MPWVDEAVQRAQHNQLKIFGNTYPALTIEDFVLSKLYALTYQRRYKDLDDLEQVLGADSTLDEVYLGGGMISHSLPIPKELRKRVEINHGLGKISREIERGK